MPGSALPLPGFDAISTRRRRPFDGHIGSIAVMPPHLALRPHGWPPTIALALALAAWLSAESGLDTALAAAAFDPATAVFPARSCPWLELVGHRLAKSFVWLVWFALLGTAIVSARVASLSAWRRPLWAATIAMASGTAVV